MRHLIAFLGLAVALPALGADTYEVDAAHSTVLFSTTHFNASKFYGRFNDVGGKVILDEANPGGSKIEITVKADSVDTNNAKREEHLNGPDFFNSKQFPTITFVSKSVSKSGDKWTVTGDFTLHGVTKQVTVPFTKIGEGDDPWGGHRSGWHAQFKLKRSDYGMAFMPPPALGDEIELIISLEGVRK